MTSWIRMSFIAALVLSATALPAHAGDTPFIGEIQTFGFPFCPRGFLPLDGQLLPISQNTALFSLLGINYGGNGVTTFALPKAKPVPTLVQGAPLLQCIATIGLFPSRN
jgi:hypothetical protein